jgi:very-short-patch-repair endonuclease/transcription elongation GreA/GreB family factor
LGLFDLVIIDEASQSDVTSLPAIIRGKKILVVGDDKQVSPSTIGIEERQIIQLRTTFLQGNPYADQMDPGSSLYDLASIVFPGKAILLREHFRCVEPIIRFSSQFYPQPLVPLRLPTATERIDPPLVDILVTDGERDARGINKAEAQVIIQEIKTIIDIPALEHRSIGIISLIGDKQAKYIYDLLLKELTPEQFARHKIMCGNAAAFQGQERDIMFLSMVECPETSTTKTSRVFEQRFNVAMSRARDRLYLVRSVAPENLKTTDLKFKVIEHFRNPMEAGQIAMSDQVLDVCDSGFEKEVGSELLKRGYRLRPQVPVAGYRLDFVVEGQGNHRLALECDGDPYHGPDRWSEDVRRQKALERLGWIFWRVWGSHWYSDKSGCVQDLLSTLDRLKISPLGPDSSPFEWTEYRIVSSEVSRRSSLVEEEEDIKPVAAAFFARAETSVKDAIRRASVPKTELRVGKPKEGIKVGDFVVVRYNDTNKVRRIFLSASENRPEDGIVHVSQPLGLAVLGADIDDEIQFAHGKGERSATIERIERSA